MLLLDTTVLIDALRGGVAADRIRALSVTADSAPFICAVNVEEIYRGLRAEEQETTNNFLQWMHIAPLGRREGAMAGRWRREFAAQGITLSQADCLIAAATVGVGARLATDNVKHFPMPELTVEHWPTS